MIGISKPTCERFKERLIIDVAIGGNPEEFDYYHSESEVQQRIEAAVVEHEQSNLNVLQGWHDECEKLKARISELEAERQPVEVSQSDALAIEWYKSTFFTRWEQAFMRGEEYEESDYEDVIRKWRYDWCLEIIKRGYTVKPDPLRTRIAAILGNDHEQLDAVVAAAREEESQ